MSVSYHYRVGIVSACLTLSACVQPPAVPPKPLVPFNPSEIQWSRVPGTATVEGQAFLMTRGGDVRYGAGRSVYLLANTPHTLEWLKRVVAGDLRAMLDSRADSAARRTVASGDGRFKFENLAAGPYIVVTSVIWEAPVGYAGSMVAQGGYIGAVIQAENGKVSSVVLTR